jgi:ribosomal protein S18 acetylase RimI-like enzyme
LKDETRDLAVAPLEAGDTDALVALWERCGLTRPWNDPRADIALAMRGTNSTILVGRRELKIVAAVMVGHDGHRGWLYYVGVDPCVQGSGFGRSVMNAAEDWLRLRGLRKVELLIRTENDAVRRFYEALGYTVEPRTVMTKWLDGRPPTP